MIVRKPHRRGERITRVELLRVRVRSTPAELGLICSRCFLEDFFAGALPRFLLGWFEMSSRGIRIPELILRRQSRQYRDQSETTSWQRAVLAACHYASPGRMMVSWYGIACNPRNGRKCLKRLVGIVSFQT